MSQIIKKFIGNNEVGAAQARLENNSYLRGRNAAGSGDISILKVNASDIPEFGVQPIYSGSNLATEAYVNSQISSASPNAIKSAARASAISNITLSGTQTIDGVSLSVGDRVLLMGQTAAADNGIWVVASGAWSRSTDADSSAEVGPMMLVGVSEGTLRIGKFYFLSTAAPIVLGTTALEFQILVPPVPTNAKENITVDSTIVTNQYVDLAQLILANSLDLSVSGVIQEEGSDYNLSTVGGVTRVTFAGDLATGGAAELVSGDVMNFKYQY